MSGSPRALSYHISALWRVSLTSQLFNQQILLVVALRCSARWPLLRPLTLRSFSILPHTRSPQAKYPSSSCVRQPGSPLLDWAIIRLSFILVDSGNGPRANLDLNLSAPLQSKLKIMLSSHSLGQQQLSPLYSVLLRYRVLGGFCGGDRWMMPFSVWV